jgi:hypothetical protein
MKGRLLMTSMGTKSTDTKGENMATRLDSGRCVRCGNALIEINPALQMCSACQKWANSKAQALIAGRKQMAPEHKRNRRKLKVGMLR